MLATIKMGERQRINYILSLNETKFGVPQINPIEKY